MTKESAMSTGKTFVFSLTCLLVFLLSANQVMAQNTITLRGRVIDGKTGEPLPYATISIPESMTSVVSNEFGEFQYHIPESFMNATVRLAYIGYKAAYVKVSAIDPEKVMVFRLEEVFSQLPEIEVSAFRDYEKLVEVVKKAVNEIKHNCPTDEALLYGYYRDYVTPVVTHKYLNLIEAALVIDDRGFRTKDYERTKFKLEQLRYNPQVEFDTAMNKAYDGTNKFIPNFTIAGANELAILRAHDPIRNCDIQTFSFVNKFASDFVSEHRFHYEKMTEVDGSKAYIINFGQTFNLSARNSHYLVNGQICIDAESFAILNFTYTINCETPTYSGKFLDLKLEYRKHLDRYYLNYLSLMNYFEYRKDTTNLNLPSKPYLQYRELFVNKIQNKPFDAFKPHEVIDKSQSLFKNKVPADNDFWKNYNYTSINKLQE